MIDSGERDRMLARIRAICLGLPEVSERLSHGAPSFFVREKRCFVTLPRHGSRNAHEALSRS